jgi:ABC-type uncharacterized transport system substrate-binding protein
MRIGRFGRVGVTLAALVGAVAAATPASAHPHVTVTHRATVVFEKGAIVAIDHVWFFDEFYSAMAVEGLDTNKDGTYSREELAELSKTNAEGLKDFDYFTFPTQGGNALKVATPTAYWSEYKDAQLSLHFRLPLEKPVVPDASAFQFSVYDPTYFIAFDIVKKDPVKLADGAPANCKIDVAVPKQEADAAKKLNESFFEQLGGGNFGLGLAKTVTVACSK